MEFNCGACGGNMFAVGDWLCRCGSCGYYRSNFKAGAGTGVSGLEQLRRANFKVILDFIEKKKPLKGSRILDIGCAQGWFLEEATLRGAIAHGIEPELANFEKCRAAGFSVESGFFPEDLKKEGSFDLIFFNDVFEHIPNPELICEALEHRLSEGGLLVINLPNSSGIIFKIASILNKIGIRSPYERLWQKGFASPHISYFNEISIKKMIENATALRQIFIFNLDTLNLAGLWHRVRASHKGIGGAFIYLFILIFSFILPYCKPDIIVCGFEKNFKSSL